MHKPAVNSQPGYMFAPRGTAMKKITEAEHSEEITFRCILPYTILAGCIFMSAWLMGYLSGLSTPQVSSFFSGQLNVELAVLNSISTVSSYSSIVKMFLIFVINAFVGYIIMSLAFDTHLSSFIIIPLSVLGGYRIGAVFVTYCEMLGLESMTLLIIPHGIFELSALFMCVGIGMLISYKIIIGRCSNLSYYPKHLVKSARKFYFYKIIPIFFIAAFIETFVTSLVYHYFA
jgi:stage II sporulation protein M